MGQSHVEAQEPSSQGGGAKGSHHGLRPCGSTRAYLSVDVSYAVPQAHRIVNVALYQEYSSGIIFIFSQARNDLYHV
jgi:hypothetical protein